jgi:hypothetical protein
MNKKGLPDDADQALFMNLVGFAIFFIGLPVLLLLVQIFCTSCKKADFSNCVPQGAMCAEAGADSGR